VWAGESRVNVTSSYRTQDAGCSCLPASVSDGDNIKDVGGGFNNVSASGGAGLAATGEAFAGTGTSGQPVHGGGFTIGFGDRAGWSDTMTLNDPLTLACSTSA
jgi:hypothetical protein